MTSVHRVLIRPMKFGDLTQVINVNETSLPDNYPRTFWDTIFHSCKSYSFVAEICNKIVGYILSNSNLIISFAMIDLYRNKGIGKQLLTHCLNSIIKSQKNIDDIDLKLHVRFNNKKAYKLYEKFNFTPITLLENYYKFPAEDAVFMKWKPTEIDPNTVIRKFKIQF